jgi:hypothetical protein
VPWDYDTNGRAAAVPRGIDHFINDPVDAIPGGEGAHRPQQEYAVIGAELRFANIDAHLELLVAGDGDEP